MLTTVVTLALAAVSSVAAVPAADRGDERGAHERITEETGLTFSVLGSILRRSIVSTDSPYGFAVKGVRPGSRGDRAGVEEGDILMLWDGRPVRDLDTLWGWIAEEEPGDEVSIEVARRKAVRSLFERDPWERHGLLIRIGRPSLFQETGIDIAFLDSWFRRSVKDEPSGLKVGLVVPDSPADAVGLRAGDVLLEWKGRPVVSFAELEEWIDEDLPGGEVEVKYARRVGGKLSLHPWDERTGTMRLRE